MHVKMLNKLGMQGSVSQLAAPKSASRRSKQPTAQPTRASKRGQAATQAFQVGEHVLAFWSQQTSRDLSRGPQYPGAIKATNPDGTYDVDFFDNLGSVDRSVPAQDIAPYVDNTPDTTPKKRSKTMPKKRSKQRLISADDF